MQSLRLFCKFNMTGASYPHHGQTIYIFLVVIVSPVYYIFQLQKEFAQDNVF